MHKSTVWGLRCNHTRRDLETTSAKSPASHSLISQPWPFICDQMSHMDSTPLAQKTHSFSQPRVTLTWSCCSWTPSQGIHHGWGTENKDYWHCKRFLGSMAGLLRMAWPCWGSGLSQKKHNECLFNTSHYLLASQNMLCACSVRWNVAYIRVCCLHSCCRYSGFTLRSHTSPMNSITGHMISMKKRTWMKCPTPALQILPHFMDKHFVLKTAIQKVTSSKYT